MVIWVLFAADYLVRLYLAPQRREFVRGHLVDLVILVVPVFRPLRALRRVPVLLRLNQRAESAFRGQVTGYVAGAAVLALFIGALAVLDAERDSPEANITSFDDALWWAVTTVTTVGYGDRFPTTAEGRWVAVVLMLAGIALLGVVTATLASWFVERLSHPDGIEAETRDDVAELAAEVRALRAELQGGHGEPTP